MKRLFALAISLLALLSCRNDRTIPAASAETPIFIISIDTLRSDRLPMYGYSGVATPHLDSLRNDGILYEHAYAHTPLTLPSHASMFTGLLPAEHGVRDNIGFPLGEEMPTIAEVLRDRGYATGAAVSAWVLRKATGMDRGFEMYDDSVEVLSRQARMIGNIQRDGAATTKVATEWIVKQQKPVFFFLHLYDPHTPYAPPEPYLSRYTDRYDGEIAYTDSVVGEFLQSLKSAGLYDKSLIIFLSDHGEGLNDHGEEEHGMFLYREVIQVPLVVKMPGQKFAGEKVTAPVQLIDLVPTIVERTGIPFGVELPGRSLLSFLNDKSPERRLIYSETYYPRFHFGWADQHSLIDGEKHYIHSTKPELFDLAKDFRETTNILEQDRRTYFAMRTAIEPLIREAETPSAIDPEDAAKLAALGYLGSTVQTKPGEILPDPKDHLDTFRDVSVAYLHYRDKKYEEALKVIDRLLGQNPRILDLHDLKSKVLTRLGRPAEAIEAGKDGLRLSPQATHIAIGLANLMLDQRQFDDARQHAELALKADPGQAHDILARIFIEQKDLVRAEQEARLAIESDSDRIASLMTMARVEREQGKLEAALQRLDDALARKKADRDVAMLHFLRGDVLARIGRPEEAEREFLREIELFPEDPPAYKSLTLLLVVDGRVAEATELIRQLIK
ncbi:MAG TPA: sulfatase-like hydrolase/transferase, partial [Thermoanaerobaculia bacterium]